MQNHISPVSEGFSENLKKKCSSYGTTPEKLYQSRTSGATISDMSRTFDIPRTSLSSLLKEMGLGDMKSKWGIQNALDIDFLYREIVENGKTISEVAELLGIGRNIVWRAATDAGIMEQKKLNEKKSICARKGIDADWLRKQIIELHRTNKEVAEELEWSTAMVARACKEEGIIRSKKTKSHRNENSRILFAEIDQYKEQLESGEVSKHDIAKHYGVSYNTVSRACADAEIFPKNTNQSLYEKYDFTEEWLIEQRIVHKRTCDDIAAEIGCPKGSIHRKCKELGVDGVVQAKTVLGKMGITKEWLIEEHLVKGRSCGDIAAELNTPRSNVESECNRYDIMTPVQYVCSEANITSNELFEKIDEEGIECEMLAEQLGIDIHWIEDIFLNYDSSGFISPYDPRRFLLTTQWLHEQRVKKNLRIIEISQETGIAYPLMKKICDTNDLYTRDIPTAEKYGFTNEWFEKKRDDEHVSQRELARQLEGKMSRTTIKKIYREIDDSKHRNSEIIFKENRNKLFRRKMESNTMLIQPSCERPNQYAHIPRCEKYDIDYDWLYQKIIVEQTSTSEMCKLLDVSYGTFSDICSEIGLVKHRMSLCEQHAIDSEQLRIMRNEENKTYEDIAEHIDIPKNLVKHMCYEEGIEQFDADSFYSKYNVDYDTLYDMRTKTCQSISAMAKQLGCSEEKLRCACFALHIPNVHQLPFAERYGISYDDIQVLIDEPKANLNNMASKLGLNPRTLERIMQEYDIQIPHNRTHSSGEDEWENFLIDNGIPYSLRQQCLLSDKGGTQEIDILIKEHGIGIEISPTYTHNHDTAPHWGGEVKSTVYHQKKAIAAEALGINLVHIFDWQDTEKMKNIILSLCGKNKRIYARNCKVHKIDSTSIEKTFFDDNHLQGYLKSEAAYGLYYEDELVAAMSFTRPRYGNKERAEWEMLRFASKSGITAVGGASKLFKAFIRNYSPESVMSFANYDISNGNMYEKLGFEYIRTTKPSYQWVKNDGSKESYSWYLIQQKGVDAVFGTDYGKGTSNKELMLSMGFVRVYNCGNKVYLWKEN